MKTNLNLNPTAVKGIALAAGLILLAIVGIYLLGRRSGRKSASSGNVGKLPSETDYGSTLTAAENEAVVSLAKRLYDSMKGLNVWASSRDESAFSDYLGASDRVFVATANYFYDNYGNGENLAQWIDGESFWWTSLNRLTNTKNAILERLAKHGITA